MWVGEVFIKILNFRNISIQPSYVSFNASVQNPLKKDESLDFLLLSLWTDDFMLNDHWGSDESETLGRTSSQVSFYLPFQKHYNGRVVRLIHSFNQNQNPWQSVILSPSVQYVCVWEIGHLTSAAFGNVASSHFSHSTWRAERLSGCRPRERDVHLFPANENGSPPFLPESCHIDSTHRHADLLGDFSFGQKPRQLCCCHMCKHI